MKRSVAVPSVLGSLLVACSPAPPAELPHGADGATTTAATTSAATTSTAESGPVPPVAARIPVTTKLHGKELVDDYAWLKNRDSKEVLDYLAAENAYTDAMTKANAPLQETLYKEMVDRLAEDDVSVPYEKGEYLYYERTEKGKQYPIRCRKPRSGKGAEQVLLDPNELAKTEKFVSISVATVSDDGSYLAYGLDTIGYRQYTLQIKDLRTGKLLPDRAERVQSFAFAGDGRNIFYVEEDAVSKRGYRVHRHTLASPKGEEQRGPDPVVFEEKDDRFEVDVERTSSEKFLVLTSFSRRTSEVRVIPAAKPETAPLLVAAREDGHEYYLDHRGSDFYIRTNSGGPNYRLVKAPEKKPERAAWKEVVAHDDAALIDNFRTFKDFTVLVVHKNGQRGLTILDAKDHVQTESVALPDPVREVRLGDNERFDAPFVRVAYESPVIPPSVYDYDVAKKSLTLKKRTEIKGHDPAKYQVVRADATAPDGTKVPVSILARKDVSPDGKNPAVLLGYGAYGLALRTTFAPERLSLVDRGVVYAWAHVRGGTDLGERWHSAGRLVNKKNSFTDFIACGEFLGSSKWADPARIVAEGRSAGGLLMGGVMNMRPDLWKGLVLGVPFVDVINTEMDTSLPLTTTDYEEFGNPRDQPIFEAMLAYSPYDNIQAKAYPSMLVFSSYHDSQVMYWEPAKLVAKLRAKKTDKNPLVLRMDMDPSGHGGKSGRYEKLQEAAFRYAWVLSTLGITR